MKKLQLYTVKEFIPLAHRFQRIATLGGVEFIDDSKATNVDSAYRALESLGCAVTILHGINDLPRYTDFGSSLWRRNKERLWKKGQPSRRHLSLMMWAYTPTPARTMNWIWRLG